jgi:hypothetical protein
MDKRDFWIALAAVVVMILAEVGIMTQKHGPAPDETYVMVNQRIEWTGAGYSGIYGGTHGK